MFPNTKRDINERVEVIITYFSPEAKEIFEMEVSMPFWATVFNFDNQPQENVIKIVRKSDSTVLWYNPI